MGEIPIIRLSIEGMKHQILHALMEHNIQTDAYVQAALERIASPENLKRLIDSEAEAAIQDAIKREAENFFRYGDGQKFIASAVAARLGQV